MPYQSARRHGVRYLLAAILVLAIGWLIGYPLITALVALAAYGLWTLYNVFSLNRWLQSPDSEVPNSFGVWSEVFDRINKLEKARHKKTRQYRSMIQDFQSLTDALPDATLVIDGNGNINWFNDTARKLLGLKAPEDLGQPVTNLLRGSDFANWLAVQSEVKSKLEMASPHDESHWLSISAVDYRKDQRLLILQDITDVHNVNQVRRDFVANISHELRTPLTVLLGYLEMLPENDAETSEVAGKMRTQARQMQALLADLLELSRLQSDEISGEDEEVDVPAMLAQLREQMDEVSRQRHRIHFTAEPGLNLRGIASDLESAFRNLLLNAVNYTPEGGRIDVHWGPMGDGAIFKVKDTGIGIPSRAIPRLTERFFRVSGDRARTSGGTGLGLSIVKHVLNAHQARLVIESELGEGSEFSCIFPRERVRFREPRLKAL
ncbi:MAG: phosphate regulon sensor histidine kinase PhoR [Xanthomonadales bacterium]|nr:phosphate regulon sensor histidine kinase PhoR [Xanthomonadales bacterium]